jgi:hypothetical protein
LIFDNYIETGPSSASPAISQSLKPSNYGMPTASSTPDLLPKEVGELRQQLQLLKQQTLTALERAKKSSENEQAALLQSRESAKFEQAATLEVARAAAPAKIISLSLWLLRVATWLVCSFFPSLGVSIFPCFVLIPTLAFLE